MSDEKSRIYINKCRAYVNFMLSQQQWSGITRADIDKWISNFSELSSQEMVYVYKLLRNLIYFSEKDVINALHDGLYNKLFYKIILNKQMEAKFELSTKALTNLVHKELANTCFIPLLDSNSPHESANYITRLLVQQGLIQTCQSMFLSNLEEGIKQYKYSRLVIVDDCVGSGDQLRTFWNKQTITSQNGETILLKHFCQVHGIEANYLVLFGYNDSIKILTQEFKDFHILCVRELSDEQRVFFNNSYIWKDEAELKSALAFFMALTNEKGLPLLGYKDLDFAFVMHQTIPDWSLPLFWKSNSDWNLLIRRKNSNV